MVAPETNGSGGTCFVEEAGWGFDWESMSEKCIEALVLAQHEAEFVRAPHVGTEHVLIGLLSGGNVGAQIFAELGVDAAIVRATGEKFRSRQTAQEIRRFSWRVRKAVEIAFEEAQGQREGFVNTDHLYAGLLRQEDCTAMHILSDLQAPVESVLARLRRPSVGPGTEGLMYPQELLGQIRVAPHLPLDSFLAVLDELGRALQSAQHSVEAALPVEGLGPPLVIPEVDPSWPVVDEEVYPIGALVRQILIGAVLRRATQLTFEPLDTVLRVEYHLPSGRVDVVEVPAVLRSVIPFRVMRMAHLNPMEKGRELEGRMVFRYRKRAHPMRVRSEPVRKGLRVVVLLG